MTKKSGARSTASSSKYEEIHFVDTQKPVWNYSLFTEEVIRNFQQGTCYDAYLYFGNKQIEVSGVMGTYFSVWAPNATRVSVTGNFNHWSPDAHPLFVRLDQSGIWEGFIPNIGRGRFISIIYKASKVGSWIRVTPMLISGN